MKRNPKISKTKTKPNPVPIQPRLYPVPGYVLQCPNDGMIVLVATTEIDKMDGEMDYRSKKQALEKHFSGVVLIPGTPNEFPVGLYSDYWDLSNFVLVATSVEEAVAMSLLS
ncbi:MAG TPA: hypothetical protein PKZ07_14475 [Sedimentisphaerales bacterium]|nr:hypothetical protein [Sedimentisphaerales bacterium]